ncbi:MAG TPA: ester cyclase [Rubrobacteraceae bacterium]|nr:ester cyclase [Rubrobacteraceae bacterium]
MTATGSEFDRIVGGKIDDAWVSYHLFADSVHDPERVKRAFAAMHHALPDLHVAQADSITEGDKIAFRWAMSGTHEGEFMGIAPTGKLVMAMGIDIVRVVDDEILDYWGEFDVMGLLRQLGVTP